VNVDVIDRERLLRGWTQRELAHRAQIDQGTLSDLLARRRRPTLGTVQAVSTALRLTLTQVITFDDGVR
jgi:transcriptional regulator with XRE-family HTH domain